jgi:hypothetical protein
LDRIDQKTLPLNRAYNPDYDGTGVDVYVLDTGLDTNHNEFKSRSGTTANIYDAYASSKTTPKADNDMQGHGTHVAGTVGGKTVGVAKGCNIFGVRILNDQGSGQVSDILSAMDYVVKYRSNKSPVRPSVVSMSLGGPCDGDCAADPMVVATENLSKKGFIVSVAAGNSGCNACFGSPNAAKTAITVGASTIDDEIAYFSNFGQCIDIFAPGLNIVSSCARTICRDEQSYLTLSGTSMACPHATGVIAQLLQKTPQANYADITRMLSCDAVKQELWLDERDTLSRNLIIQVPRQSTDYSLCSLGAGCDASCSNAGVCLPVMPPGGGYGDRRLLNNKSSSALQYPSMPSLRGAAISPAYYSSDNLMCRCDSDRYGDTCADSSDRTCPDPRGHSIAIDLYDAFGDGWTFASYTIRDPNTERIVSGGFDSLCEGTYSRKSHCLQDGCYLFDVSMGLFPQENQWKMCGIKGGTPYLDAQFCVRNGRCVFKCPNGAFVDVTMSDSLGGGWDGAYYEMYTPNGKMTYGGSLIGGEVDLHTLCLPQGCSYLMLETTTGDVASSDINFEVCGSRGSGKAVTEVCIDESGSCSVRNPLKNAPPCPASHTAAAIYMFDHSLNGWDGATYTISNKNELHAHGSLVQGFAESEVLCLQDGCYDFKVTGGERPGDIFWNLCGFRGGAPFQSEICVEKQYGLCYGLSGCPRIKSYLHHKDEHHYFLYHYSADVSGNLLDTVGNVHGVHEVCHLTDSVCYEFAAGSGKLLKPDEINSIEICGHQVSLPSRGQICMSKDPSGANKTICTPRNLHRLSCPSNAKPQLFSLVDQSGNGWGSVRYSIYDSSSKRLYSSQLSKGEFDAHELCLPVGCYSLKFTASNVYDIDDVLWVLCGIVGPAIESATFCVTDLGCEFDLSGGGGYYYGGGGYEEITDDLVDDDFPIFIDSDAPTRAPTSPIIVIPQPSYGPSLCPSAAPSLAPTPIPTNSPSSLGPTYPAETPTPRPTPAPTGSPTAHPSQAPSDSPSAAPTAAPTRIPIPPVVIVEFDLSYYMSVEKLKMSMLHPNRHTDDDLMRALDFSFVADGVRRVIDEMNNPSIKLWNVSSALVSYISSPSLLSNDEPEPNTRKHFSNERYLVWLKSNIDDRMMSNVLRTANVQHGEGVVSGANEYDVLHYLVTERIRLEVANADLKSSRSAWSLREIVDVGITVAFNQKTVERKLRRALNTQLDRQTFQGEQRIIKVGSVTSLHINTDSIPQYVDAGSATQKTFEAVDDDDLFDDFIGGPTDQGGSDGSGGEDKSEVIRRTNMLAGGITVVFSALVFWFIVIIYRSYAHQQRGFSRPTRKSYLVLDEDKTSHQTDASSTGESKHRRMKSEQSKAKGIGSRAKQFTKKLASKTSAILKAKKRTSVVKSVALADVTSPSSNEEPQIKGRFSRMFGSSISSARHHHHEKLRDVDDDAEEVIQRLNGPRGFAEDEDEDEDLEEIILNGGDEVQSDSYRVINKVAISGSGSGSSTINKASQQVPLRAGRQQSTEPTSTISTDVHGNEDEDEDEEEEVTLMLHPEASPTASHVASPSRGPSSSSTVISSTSPLSASSQPIAAPLDDALVSLTIEGDEDEEIEV